MPVFYAAIKEPIEVAPITRPVLEKALHLGFSDYEDAVLHAAAQQARADGIVTRNVPEKASLPIYTPPELLHILQAF